jgi:nucleoside-diphosphate-sugar epimerase
MLKKRIAILGATSQIAKDLVKSFVVKSGHELVLYSRRPRVVSQWMTSFSLTNQHMVADFAAFNINEHFDAIINFVGIGDPAKAIQMGSNIFDVTLQYDELVLKYLRNHPHSQYIFISSGSAYGVNFDAPADENTQSVIAINNLQPQEWYSVAKLHAECRHRSLASLSIVDIRIFNYFSHTQDLNARFLITDIVRAIQDRTVLKISKDYLKRDFIGPDNLYQLVEAILASAAINAVVDCYSKEPIDKISLLKAMEVNFGLKYELTENINTINATGIKKNYYSINKRASQFNYKPTLTSLMNINKELRIILSNSKENQT